MTPPKSRRLLAATNNGDKLREIRQILADTDWEVIDLSSFPSYPEPVEDGATLLDNALIKATEGFNRTRILTLADDTGLEIDALQGRPGLYSARYAGANASYADNVNKVLKDLEGVPPSDRTARFRCVMALVREGIREWWEGVAEGVITTEPRGANGFGYDPLFWSPELGMTFAQAPLSDKNKVSHRARALAELRERLIKGIV